MSEILISSLIISLEMLEEQKEMGDWQSSVWTGDRKISFVSVCL